MQLAQQGLSFRGQADQREGGEHRSCQVVLLGVAQTAGQHEVDDLVCATVSEGHVVVPMELHLGPTWIYQLAVAVVAPPALDLEQLLHLTRGRALAAFLRTQSTKEGSGAGLVIAGSLNHAISVGYGQHEGHVTGPLDLGAVNEAVDVFTLAREVPGHVHARLLATRAGRQTVQQRLQPHRHPELDAHVDGTDREEASLPGVQPGHDFVGVPVHGGHPDGNVDSVPE